MRRFRIILPLLGLFTLATSVSAQMVQDPNQPDTLRVDSATAFVSGIGVIPVNFFNDENLTLVEVTLGHESSLITIDSFSFAGGRLDSAAYSNDALIKHDSTVVAILSLSFSTPIPPGNGLMGKLYCSYSNTIDPQVIPFDSVTWLDGPILHSTSFRETGSMNKFIPQFIPGCLDILETPTSFDSVWIDDLESSPGEPVAVNVYAYNERDLAKMAVALDYSSPNLQFDSVSFAGTRSEPAQSKTVQPQTSQHKLYTVIAFTDGLALAPGSGPIATIHFTVDPATPEGVIVIDSTTVGIISNTRFTLTLSDGSLTFVPLFRPGSVDVKTSTDVEDITDRSNLPSDYNLAQNYPNPFNPITNIEFSLPHSGRVRIEVFNILGRKVRELLDRELPAGIHRLVFDGRTDRGTPLATGVYFYRIATDNFQATKKMLLLK